MIYINRSVDKKFYVTVVGENNEDLSVVEMLNTKASAYKNIAAQFFEYRGTNGMSIIVTDKTFKTNRKTRLTLIFPKVGKRTYKIDKV